VPVGELVRFCPAAPLWGLSLLGNREEQHMWDEIMDMPGEIFDMDIDDRDQMPLDMQEDIEHDDPLNWNDED
jgi:hypothetical protein